MDAGKIASVVHMNYNWSHTQSMKETSVAANALIQARIDAAVKERATEVLNNMGLTVSDAVRILLTRVAKEGALPPGLASDPAIHDAWFRAKVREALEDQRPAIPHDEVEAHFARRRAAALRRTNEGKA
jgi:DNA-damage-inducible protein J